MKVTSFKLMLQTIYIRKKSPYVQIFEGVAKGDNLVAKMGDSPKGGLQAL